MDIKRQIEKANDNMWGVFTQYDMCIYSVEEKKIMKHKPKKNRSTWSLGSFVIGLLQRSMVFALDFVALPHHDSHHSHSCGNENMGTVCWA